MASYRGEWKTVCYEYVDGRLTKVPGGERGFSMKVPTERGELERQLGDAKTVWCMSFCGGTLRQIEECKKRWDVLYRELELLNAKVEKNDEPS